MATNWKMTFSNSELLPLFFRRRVGLLIVGLSSVFNDALWLSDAYMRQ